jgi:prepilin-type N-terminal cleavage/methylation domain-containing protein
MKKRGFTIIELLIVVALIGILVGIGGVSIKKQAESKAMLRVQNEIGDFFRIAAKRSQETGKKYAVEFKLDENLIEVSRVGFLEELKLPNMFDYSIKPPLTDGKATLTTTGNISDNFTLYISNSKEIKHAINFNKDDSHIKYLHIREYSPTNNSISISAMTPTPSAILNLKLIRD